MTSMPDAVAAPPRSAPPSPQRSGPAGDDARDHDDFASLVDDAAEDDSDGAATRADRPRNRKEPGADGGAAAQASVIQAVVQAGGTTDAPLMPWMVASGQAVSDPAAAGQAVWAQGAANPPTPATAEAGADTSGTAAPQAQVPPQAGRTAGPAPSGPAQPASGMEADPAVPPTPAAVPPAQAAAADSAAADPAADPAARGTAIRDAAGRTAATAPLPTGSAPPASATPPAEVPAIPAADGRESRRAESTDPRTAGRATRAAGRQGASATAEQPGAASAAPPAGKPPTAEAVASAAQAAPDLPAAPASLPAGTGGNAPATGFEALPTLPAQAATHYAAAAASGRAATAHSPAMAQLAAPLVRVLESGGGEFHIDLAPAELGRIRVVADVNDGKVSLTVQAEQADTLALLRRDVQQLERALGDAGLSLDNAGLQFSLQGDGQSRGFAAPDRGGAPGGWHAPSVAETVPDLIDDRPMRPIDGLVDVTV